MKAIPRIEFDVRWGNTLKVIVENETAHIGGTAISAREIEWCRLIGGCKRAVHVRKRSRTALRSKKKNQRPRRNHKMRRSNAHFREDGQRYATRPRLHKGGRN